MNISKFGLCATIDVVHKGAIETKAVCLVHYVPSPWALNDPTFLIRNTQRLIGLSCPEWTDSKPAASRFWCANSSRLFSDLDVIAPEARILQGGGADAKTVTERYHLLHYRAIKSPAFIEPPA